MNGLWTVNIKKFQTVYKSLTKLKPYITYVQRIISGYFLLIGYKKLLSAERRFLPAKTVSHTFIE